MLKIETILFLETFFISSSSSVFPGKVGEEEMKKHGMFRNLFHNLFHKTITGSSKRKTRIPHFQANGFD